MSLKFSGISLKPYTWDTCRCKYVSGLCICNGGNVLVRERLFNPGQGEWGGGDQDLGGGGDWGLERFWTRGGGRKKAG